MIPFAEVGSEAMRAAHAPLSGCRFGRRGYPVLAGLVAGLIAFTGAQGVGTAQAQELREAVEMAVRTHPLVASTRAGYRAAGEGVKEIEGEFLPSLDLSADTGYQRAHRPVGSSVDQNLWRNKQRLALTQMLYDGQGTSNRADSSRATAEAAQFEVEAAAIRVARRAIKAYLDVARDRKLVDFAGANIDLHNRILGDVSEAARTGGGSESRVAQVKTRLFNAQSQRRRAEGNLKNSISAYVEAIGQMPGNLQERPFPTSAPPATVEAAITEAMKNNPTLLSSIEEEKASKFTAEAERSAFLPNLDLEFAHERRDGVDGTSGHETDSTALVKLSWNFYKGGSDQASVRRALERASEAMYKIHEIDRQIRRELDVALNDYQVTRDQVTLLRDRVATAQEVTTAYGEQFRLGQRTLIELLDSGNELFLARTDLTSREYEQILAAYEFLAVKGTLLQDLGVRVDMGDTSAPKK